MAEILQMAFQNAIEEQGEMEDKKSKKAPAIDSVIVTGPDIIQLPKTGEKEVATDEGADAVQAPSPEFNRKPTQSNMNDAGTNAAKTAKEANERAPDEKVDSFKAVPPELNPKLTKPGENDADTEASAAEAKVTASDQVTSPVIASTAELNPNPTKPTANDAVMYATSMVEDSEVMAVTVPDGIPMVMATKDVGVTVSQGEVSQPPSVDQMLLDLKRKRAKAEENKSSDATAKGSVEPAMFSLSALSTMPPCPGQKADEYQPATQYTPSPGPTPDKNRPTTRSTPSPDPKKKQSPMSAGADEPLMP
jgi:hypothetical protein